MNERHMVVGFYVRRFFRIAPVYYTGIILYFLLDASRRLGHDSIEPSASAYGVSSVLANVFFVHGFVPYANNNIVPGGWSIGTEMAFYAIFPLAFYVAKKYFSRNLISAVAFVVATFAASQIGLVVIAAFCGGHVSNNNFLYFNLLNQMPVFAIGIALYLGIGAARVDAESAARARRFSARMLIYTAALTGLALTLWRFAPDIILYTSKYSVIPVISGLSFASLVAALRTSGLQFPKILVYVGKVSFSMYVVHFFFAWNIARPLVRALYGRGVIPEVAFVVAMGLTVMATLFIASFSYRYIERPAVRLGNAFISSIQRRGPPETIS